MRLHALGAVLGAPILLASPALGQVAGDAPRATDPGPPVASEEAPDPAEQPAAAPEATRLVFTPEDFARFAPKTALDMLDQVPGFTIQKENTGRGLGQASGNVLINGERVSAKSTSTRDQLSRITAINVVRIELVDGATLDIPGLTGRVANVVTRSTGNLSGRFDWRPQFSSGPSKLAWADGEVSLTGAAGPVAFTLALENPTFYGGSAGPNRVTDSQGNVRRLATTTYTVFDLPTATGAFAIDLPGEASANLNLKLEHGIRRGREREFEPDPAGPLLDENLRTINDRTGYEIGGDVTLPLGPGRLKLIALESYGHEMLTSRSLLMRAGSADSGSQFDLDFKEGERIGRGEYTWKLWGADWQVSAEGAFNRLDQIARLSAFDPPSGTYLPLPFPAGSGGVREDRYEGALSYSRPLTANLSLQATVGGEYSKIAQTGANALARTFIRPKGSIALAWSAGERLDVSLVLERRVGQLSFSDFLAQVNLSDDNANAGNNRLRPAQTWVTELETVRDFGAIGSATVKLYDRRIKDFVTIIPLPGGGESRGNIDKARRYGLEFTGTLRTDPLGFAGGQFDISAALEHSRLKDPLTFVPRSFDRSQQRRFEVDFRHDVPATSWAYGVEYAVAKAAPYFRLGEEGYEYSQANNLKLFIENKNVAGMTVRLRASNLLDTPVVLDRTVYQGPRTGGVVQFSEDRRRKIGVVFNLSVAGTF